MSWRAPLVRSLHASLHHDLPAASSQRLAVYSQARRFGDNAQSMNAAAAAPSAPAMSKLGLAFAGATALTLSALFGNKVHCRSSEPHLVPAFEGPGARSTKQNWTLYDQIGEGAFGVVHLGMCRETGELAAVKMVDARKSSAASLEREIQALKRIKSLGGHKNIIDLKDVYVDGRNMCLVTELVAGGELFDHIVANGAMKEDSARHMMHDIAQAVYFLHSNGMIHKDLKPENVLLSKSSKTRRNSWSYITAKLVDFGSAGPSTPFSKHEDVGTSAYLSPELLAIAANKEQQPTVYTNACDMWALGCILYIMVTGAHPFDMDGTAADAEVERRILNAEVSFEHPACKGLSAEVKDLITNLLQKDPTKRFTSQDVLAHPWMQRQMKQ